MLLIESDAQLIMSHCIVRVVLDCALQRVSRSIGVALMDLHLTAINQSFDIARICFKNFIIQLGGFVEAVLQNHELNVVLLDLNIFGMVPIERAVLRGGFVEIAIGKIKITQHALAFTVSGKNALGLFEEG